MEFYGDLERRFNEGTAAVEELEAAGVLRGGGLVRDAVTSAIQGLPGTMHLMPVHTHTHTLTPHSTQMRAEWSQAAN